MKNLAYAGLFTFLTRFYMNGKSEILRREVKVLVFGKLLTFVRLTMQWLVGWDDEMRFFQK
jgi:hypothetical protein